MMSIARSTQAFDLRPHETLVLSNNEPTAGFWVAVMLRKVRPPDNEKPIRDLDEGYVVACQKEAGGDCWQWAYLTPMTADEIRNVLWCEPNFTYDRWYYVSTQGEQ